MNWELLSIPNFFRVEVLFVSEAFLTRIHRLIRLYNWVWVFVARTLSQALSAFATRVDPPRLRVRYLIGFSHLPWNLRSLMNDLVVVSISIIKLNRKQSLTFVWVSNLLVSIHRQFLQSSLLDLLVEMIGVMMVMINLHVHVFVTSRSLPALVEILRIVCVTLEQSLLCFLNLVVALLLVVVFDLLV